MKRLVAALLAVAALAALSPLWVKAAHSLPEPTTVSALAGLGVDDSEELQEAAMMLESCIGEARGSRTAAKCIGTIAEACLKAAGAPGERACYRREAEGWSVLVDRYRSRLERRYGTDPAKLVRINESQREWIADRDRRCGQASDMLPSASSGSACEMKESGRRALYLRILAEQAGLL